MMSEFVDKLKKLIFLVDLSKYVYMMNHIKYAGTFLVTSCIININIVKFYGYSWLRGPHPRS